MDTLVDLYAPDCLEDLEKHLVSAFGEGSFLIITDSRIWSAVSARFANFLAARPDTTLYILPAVPAPYASDTLVAKVHAVIEATGGTPVAVGSGTVNDVVKRASFETGRRYACIPTAPSVDGFTSFGAAILVDGFKMTLECPAPLCVIAEDGILCSAPSGLLSAGYGDMLAKLTGGADWILADAMGMEAIDRTSWNLVQPVARGLLGQGAAVMAREPRAVGALYRGLVASGLAMQHYRDSRPASGAEHLLSHTWEMSHLAKDGKAVSHGFKVAIGTLASAALAEELFSPEGTLGQCVRDRGFAPAADLLPRRLELAKSLLAGTAYEERTLSVVRSKTPGAEALAARVALAKSLWQEIASRYAAQIPSFFALKADLASGGCPVEPGEIGLSREACLRSLRIASLIRGRYTVLDLVAELGILDEAAEAVFSKRYFSAYESR